MNFDLVRKEYIKIRDVLWVSPFLFTPLLLLPWAPQNHLVILVRCSTILTQRKAVVSPAMRTVPLCKSALFFLAGTIPRLVKEGNVP